MLLNCGAGEKTPESHWTARRPDQSILKEISPKYSLEGLILKLKLQCFGHLIWRANSLEKTDAEKDWRQKEMRATEDEMVGWPHQLNWHELGQTPGDGEGQGDLACHSLWDHKELDTTWWLKNINNKNMSCIGFPDGSWVKRIHLQCRRNRRPGCDPWIWKIPWRNAWQPTLVFLPGESHRQRNLAGYSLWGRKSWTWLSD